MPRPSSRITYSNETPFGSQEKADREIVDNTRSAYEQTMSQADRNRSPVAQLQKMARLFRTRWDSTFKRTQRRAANALKQLEDVPLTAENVNWQFEQALRDAFKSAIQEEAEYDDDRPPGEPPPDMDKETVRRLRESYRQNQSVRTVFMRAIRVDVGPEDVKRVTDALDKIKD